MTFLKITLKPIEPSDYMAIARLQSAAFAHEEFGAVAFGTQRFSDAAMEVQAKSLAEKPKPGETRRHIKAVSMLPDGTEEIVGFANWTLCVGRGGSDEEKRRLGTKESWVLEDGKEKEKEKDPWGPGANVRLCEDALVGADAHMARSTEGLSYAKLSVLVVSPKCQRRGIGTLLVEDGLRKADEAGLQTVLGASPFGIGLYRRYGFVDYETMDIKLWEYEGGKGMGTARHVIMNRPAVTQSNWV